MKSLLYVILRAYVWLGLKFYFSSLKVYGRENIPRSGALIFTANHQNAFLDALLLVTNNGRKNHFVARAEVFKKPLFKWLLSLINMMPIYRVRDGWQSLQQNDAIFEACRKILINKETLLIFPEGNHGFDRKLRPLSKGFSRIAFGTLMEDRNLNLKIIPVGINYHKHQSFRTKVSIHYGKPIEVSSYLNPDDEHNASLALRNDLAVKMKLLITQIESDNYQAVFDNLIQRNVDFSDPSLSNKMLKNEDLIIPPKRSNVISAIMRSIFRLNAIIPLIIWWRIKKVVKDPVMLASIKFAVGISVFPIFFILQSIALGFMVNAYSGLCYFAISVLGFVFSHSDS